MEKTMTLEEKIKKAEDIYNRRRENENIGSINESKNIKRNTPLKKMRNQVIICIVIYGIINLILNNDYTFSKEVKARINEILSYDISIDAVVNNIIGWWDSVNKTIKQDGNSDVNVNTVIEEKNINM